MSLHERENLNIFNAIETCYLLNLPNNDYLKNEVLGDIYNIMMKM